jgi:hypothetical protein
MTDRSLFEYNKLSLDRYVRVGVPFAGIEVCANSSPIMSLTVNNHVTHLAKSTRRYSFLSTCIGVGETPRVSNASLFRLYRSRFLRETTIDKKVIVTCVSLQKLRE